MGCIKKTSKKTIFKKIDKDTSRKAKQKALLWLQSKQYETHTGISKHLNQRLESVVYELSKFTSALTRCQLGLKIEKEAKARFSTPLDRFNYVLQAYEEELEKRAAEELRRNKI